MKATSLTAISLFVLIGFGGFMAGRISSSNANDTAAVMEGPSQTKSTRRTSPLAMGNSSMPAARQAPETRVAMNSLGERLDRLTSIINDKNPLDRNRALLTFIDQLSPNDFEDVVAGLTDMRLTDNRREGYAMLLTAWAAMDPLAALAYVTENAGSSYSSDIIVGTWATDDPEGAIRWAEANYIGDGANPYLASIIGRLSGSDPERATQLLTGMPKSGERSRALYAMLPKIISNGIDAAQDWISNLQDDGLRNEAIAKVAEQLEEAKPAEAAKWLIANPSEDTRGQFVKVYGTWAEQEPEAAISSFTALPSGHERSNALQGIINSISTKDPQTTISLMNRYPNDVTDYTVNRFAYSIADRDPSAAMNQIARISQASMRDSAYVNVLSSWRIKDPIAAESWIRNNPLPQNIKDRLGKQVKIEATILRLDNW